jgi:hypothetical protein
LPLNSAPRSSISTVFLCRCLSSLRELVHWRFQVSFSFRLSLFANSFSLLSICGLQNPDFPSAQWPALFSCCCFLRECLRTATGYRTWRVLFSCFSLPLLPLGGDPAVSRGGICLRVVRLQFSSTQSAHCFPSSRNFCLCVALRARKFFAPALQSCLEYSDSPARFRLVVISVIVSPRISALAFCCRPASSCACIRELSICRRLHQIRFC